MAIKWRIFLLKIIDTGFDCRVTCTCGFANRSPGFLKHCVYLSRSARHKYEVVWRETPKQRQRRPAMNPPFSSGHHTYP